MVEDVVPCVRRARKHDEHTEGDPVVEHVFKHHREPSAHPLDVDACEGLKEERPQGAEVHLRRRQLREPAESAGTTAFLHWRCLPYLLEAQGSHA